MDKNTLQVEELDIKILHEKKEKNEDKEDKEN